MRTSLHSQPTTERSVHPPSKPQRGTQGCCVQDSAELDPARSNTRDLIYFNLASNRLNHAYGYRHLPASEWLAGSSRVDGLLDQIAHMLNSNENFEMDDSFQLSFTQVRASPRGSGHKQKLKPGHSHPATFKRMKHSVVTIKNKDDLCCAHANMTSKAKVDNHSRWQSFQKVAKIQ